MTRIKKGLHLADIDCIVQYIASEEHEAKSVTF